MIIHTLREIFICLQKNVIVNNGNKCFKELDNSFTEISLKKAKKSERVEYVLLAAMTPISKQEIIEKVPDISVKTVELVLSRMMKDNKITKIGTFKDARYMRKM